jgi:hypothetical protein
MVSTNLEEKIHIQGKMGSISQYWKCRRCGGEYQETSPPGPDTPIRAPIIGPWSGKSYVAAKSKLSCDEYIVYSVQES